MEALSELINLGKFLWDPWINGATQLQMISILIILTVAHKAYRSNTVLAELDRAMDSVTAFNGSLP